MAADAEPDEAGPDGGGSAASEGAGSGTAGSGVAVAAGSAAGYGVEMQEVAERTQGAEAAPRPLSKDGWLDGPSDLQRRQEVAEALPLTLQQRRTAGAVLLNCQ